MNQNKPSKNQNASALIAVIITIAILSLLAGAFVSNVNNRRMTLSQGSTWQEALVAAEAGAHQGIAQVEQGVFQNSLPASTILLLQPTADAKPWRRRVNDRYRKLLVDAHRCEPRRDPAAILPDRLNRDGRATRKQISQHG